MSRAAARLRHPSAQDSAALYAEVREAHEQLEHALETHDSLAATAAAVDWWLAIERLREASDG